MATPTSSSDTGGGIPLWVRVQGILVILLVLVVLGMFTGFINIGLLPGIGDHVTPAGGH